MPGLYGSDRYGDGAYGGGVVSGFGVGNIPSEEAFGTPRLLGTQLILETGEIVSAEAFGKPLVLGGVPPQEPFIPAIAGLGIRDDERYTCWPRDDALVTVSVSEADPLYAVLVSNE